MFKLFQNLKAKEWILFAISLVFLVSQVWLDLKLPDYMSEITQLVQTSGSDMKDILEAGASMLLCALGSLVATFVTAGIAARIAANFSARLRARLFNTVQSFSMEEINNFSTASLVTRSTNDVNQVQMFIVMGLQLLIKAPITAIWALTKIMDKSAEWTMATGVAVVILLTIVGICVFFALPRFRKIQQLTDNLNKIARENLSGLRVIRAYNAEAYQEVKFTAANNDLTANNLYTSSVMAILMPSITLVMSGLSLSIYWIGAVLLSEAEIPARMEIFADMIVFSSYAMQVVMSFMMLVMVFIMLPRAAVAAKRINEVLETKPSITIGVIASSPVGTSGEIEFKNVSFKYTDGDDYVLENISFKAKRGETIAFIGATGCGKSTLVNLIPRFYDVTEGEVLVNGVNVKDYDQQVLRNKLGYVSQKAVLFEGTVESNVDFGDNGKAEADIHQVMDAVNIAQASEFVENMEGTYEA
ncbi:MAG: ABC transporter ATP-binding protein, partial [Turicibacter sp.]|nr:ABC transporter ATP-binding protein [Turicibacter sp.]